MIMRLKRIEGQVRGVQRMIEEEANCEDILNQITAVKAAINQVGLLIFEEHAYECIAQAMDEGNREEAFQDVVRMMGRLIKNT